MAKITKSDRIRLAELFVDGFTLDELSKMYDVSIFCVMGMLGKFGIDV
jgi:hypothetical protein